MPEIQKELIGKRTANSKTFDIGNGRRQLVVSIGDVHYKDNYADLSEKWKDIDLIWEGNRITKAPYALIHEGNKLTLKIHISPVGCPVELRGGKTSYARDILRVHD
ncbi:unnamed protein product [marine sediment metagenome]|uniref:Uncharacterized protein n=1 Tax=marine sediment metagenome TaxID=412755 RepID=X1S7U7_9ZZZZ